MSKSQLKITDRVAMTLACPEGKRTHRFADISGNGLCLIVSTAGSRVWKFRYSYADRRNDLVTLGSATLVSYEEAKEMAADLQRMVTVEKRDPRAFVYKPSKGLTLDTVLDDYIEALNPDPRKRGPVISAFKPIRRELGRRLLRDITSADIVAFMEGEYSATDTRPNRGGAGASMLRSLLAAINLAMKTDEGRGLGKDFKNPARGLKRAVKAVNDRVKTTHARNFEDDEFGAIMKSIRLGYEGDKTGDLGIMVVELCLLTGARPNEIESLQWGEVQPQPGEPNMLRIVKATHKTFGRTGRPRIITCGPRAKRVLDRARQFRIDNSLSGTWVFPVMRAAANKRTPHFNSTNQVARELSKLAGVEFRPYNLRSAYINHTLDSAENGDAGTFHATLAMVAENVGHANVAMTLAHYVKSKPSRIVAAAKTADEAFARYEKAA